MTTETREQTLLRKFAQLLREPKSIERNIFHSDALDEMRSAGPEDREALAAKLDALADQQQATRRVDRTDMVTGDDEHPRAKLIRETASMWKSPAQRVFEDGTEPPKAA